MSAGCKILDNQNNSLTFTSWKKKTGWPLKRLLDRYGHEAKTGHLLA